MLEEGNTLIQVVVGPRQTGKSTMIAQALRGLDVLAHSVSADDILPPPRNGCVTNGSRRATYSGCLIAP